MHFTDWAIISPTLGSWFKETSSWGNAWLYFTLPAFNSLLVFPIMEMTGCGVYLLSSVSFLRVHSCHLHFLFLICQHKIESFDNTGKLSFHNNEAPCYIPPPQMVQREAGWGGFPVRILLLLNTWDSAESFLFFLPLNTHVEPHAICRASFSWILKETLGRKAASRTCYGGSWEPTWYLWGKRNKSLKGVWSERTWKETMAFFFHVCLGLQGSTHLALIPFLF